MARCQVCRRGTYICARRQAYPSLPIDELSQAAFDVLDRINSSTFSSQRGHSIIGPYREGEPDGRREGGREHSPGESFEPAMQRAREINEQIMEMARKAGHQLLDAYVRWLEEVAEQQRKIASGTPVSQMDWLAGMLNAQADFARQFSPSRCASSPAMALTRMNS